MAIRKPKVHEFQSRFWSKQGNRVTQRTARIEHQCSQCYGNIAVDDKYREITGDDGYNHYTVRICKNCFGKKSITDDSV